MGILFHENRIRYVCLQKLIYLCTNSNMWYLKGIISSSFINFQCIWILIWCWSCSYSMSIYILWTQLNIRFQRYACRRGTYRRKLIFYYAKIKDKHTTGHILYMHYVSYIELLYVIRQNMYIFLHLISTLVICKKIIEL